ncbi:AAA family ATPase, partial [Candidatus Woesearchaeota archaeon]|nr:AAA family ATPase [Candidatus Woesearchaeota archaeon]
MTHKLIVISGTPGTGKTTWAKILAKKLKYARLDLHDHYKEISTGYNRRKQAYDI